GRTVEEHRELARRGLRRVHLGVESGDEGLLRFLEKPTSRAGMLARVAGLKGAGISASVILLVGAGGRAFAEAHHERSLDLVASMGLGPGDIVYLSPLAAGPDTEYARRLREEGIEPLAEPELLAEEARLRRGLAAVLGPRGAKVARYDLRSFVYY
ncbi:MAG: radical SAM protein, partial [Planctomycetes bacterium]|nr:radical SAM protein [Planctomycetota bacterium]